MKIIDIKGYEILTTAGTSTVCVELFLEGEQKIFYGHSGSASQGTSKSIYEPKYDGLIKAQNFVGIAPIFSANQDKIDQAIREIKQAIVVEKDITAKDVDTILCKIDETENNERLGASFILATSIAAYKAEAASKNIGLDDFLAKKFTFQEKFHMPIPLINMINGGLHASSPTIPIQEILLVPTSDQSEILSLILFSAQSIFFTLQKLLKKKSIFYGFGLEGGISALWKDINQPIELLLEAIELSGFSNHFSIGFDCAASIWFNQKNKQYTLFPNKKEYSGDQLINWYISLRDKYSIVYFEDPFAEQDSETWKHFKNDVADNNIHIIGDDLCATQVKHIARPDIKEMINGVIIKPSQAGTITDTIAAINAAKSKNLTVIVSRRSCETEDNFIVDLALAGSSFCKLGNITQAAAGKYNLLHTFFIKAVHEALKKQNSAPYQ